MEQPCSKNYKPFFYGLKNGFDSEVSTTRNRRTFPPGLRGLLNPFRLGQVRIVITSPIIET
jgi:hypothetical protein